jgi:hypothetical protein
MDTRSQVKRTGDIGRRRAGIDRACSLGVVSRAKDVSTVSGTQRCGACEPLLVSAQSSVGGVRCTPPIRAGLNAPIASRRGVACNNRAISTGEQGCPAVNCGQEEKACEQQLRSFWLVRRLG